jgi:multiple sugar transport system ATP-binding protein
MSVRENLAFGLKLRSVASSVIEKRVAEVSDILGLNLLLERKPKALSGGQRQRVALGRAIVREPQVFLMDEPLSNLDAKLRVQMRAEINKLHKRLNTTIIYVTHDQTEAMTMGDRITVLHDGFVQQCDTPQIVYDRPANKFVAGFIGSPAMNFVTCRVTRGTLLAPGLTIVLPDKRRSNLMRYEGMEVDLGFRPEHVYPKEACTIPATADNTLAATIEVVEPMGSESYVYFGVGEHTFITRMPPSVKAQYGASMVVVIDTLKVHLFERTGNGAAIALD